VSAGPEKIIRDEIRALTAYHVQSAEGLVKLDAMENPYRLPDGLRREIAEVVANAEINRYPDPTAPALMKRLRDVMGIGPEYDVLLGNGSDEIIHIIIQSVARPGAVVLAPRPCFFMFSHYAKFAGLRYVGVLLNPDFTLDTGAFLRALIEHRPAVVFIDYPNNPSGNLFADEAIAQIIAAAPGLVVIDEAYHPFAGKTFMTRLPEFPNLVVMRTLSKLGLAGIRLGYAVASTRSASASTASCASCPASRCFRATQISSWFAFPTLRGSSKACGGAGCSLRTCIPACRSSITASGLPSAPRKRIGAVLPRLRKPSPNTDFV
jgi:histidinol-phosphate aminotransferase